MLTQKQLLMYTRWALSDLLAESKPKTGDIVTITLYTGEEAEYQITVGCDNSALLHLADVSIKKVSGDEEMPDFVATYSNLDHPWNRRPPLEDRR